jgi:hypothetical protein
MLKIISIILFVQINILPQITGLWEVSKVKVSEEEMTPVAKWTRFNPDGTFESGNGWMKSSEGTWNFDNEQGSIELITKNGLIDEFGPFKVLIEKGKMIWSRLEGTDSVNVISERIENLPAGPADKIQGLWDLESAVQNGKDISGIIDPTQKRYIFIRWDRIFVVDNTDDGRITGFWHMNGHRPILTLIFHDRARENETYEVTFEGSTMQMKNYDKNSVLKYTRIDKFP